MAPSRDSRLPLVLTRLTWTLVAVVAAGVAWRPGGAWTLDPVLHVDGLTQVMALVTTLVSAIVHSFARRYMAGGRRLDRFYGRLFLLTLIVIAMTAADHLALFAGLWTAMGWLLAGLIGHVRGWPQARAAERAARRVFLGGSALLGAALVILGASAGATTITGVIAELGAVPPAATIAAAVLLLGAAMAQSALVPFHRWLLSSMTAPTPVSAFMHAGLVNAGGVLLARFAPVVFDVSGVMIAVVAVGGVSALLGQAWMLVQTDVKRQLGCSTVAQMGFMVLQGGLGFVPAAITHLILHGFYKAYLFLSAGSVVEPTRPPAAGGPSGEDASRGRAAGLLSGGVALAAALAGGALFAGLTGKSLTALDSGTLLVLFVVVAVLHATRSMIRRSALSATARLVAVPATLLPALGLYAAVYNGVKGLLAGLPAAVAPTALTPLHWGLAVAFVLAYVAVERGWHRRSPRLYVALLNTSRPVSSTLLTRRTQYHAH
jgi:NAD(P)H-quinone oxidoreductase subunit 5